MENQNKLTANISGFIFELNQNDHSATLCRTEFIDEEEVTIPDSILYQNKAYKVCFFDNFLFAYNKNTKTIKFHENAEIENIQHQAFEWSSITTIIFPSQIKQFEQDFELRCDTLKTVIFPENLKLKNLDVVFEAPIESINIPKNLISINQNMFTKCSNLNQIIISPNNQFFGYLDEDMKLIGKKSDQNQDNFDILIFACRDIKRAIIPSNIEVINSYSFSDCKKLNSIEFSNNSNLREIKKNAFSRCSIENIVIPANVIRLSQKVFDQCYNLKKVEFEENSKIHSIDKNTFEKTPIKSILLPTNVNCVRCNAFLSCSELACFECLGDDLFFESNCFNNCSHLLIISCPNALQIYFDANNNKYLNENCVIYVQNKALIL
ncbi:hypothetical protein M9Y10_026722 [Tritrichomonas musculus]|uniref:Surface antigen BspA-like n=1 Tax=Tritrichomonas musculus TaxID=1915356 RepID=A0ABR2H7G9_9EUKA